MIRTARLCRRSVLLMRASVRHRARCCHHNPYAKLCPNDAADRANSLALDRDIVLRLLEPPLLTGDPEPHRQALQLKSS